MSTQRTLILPLLSHLLRDLQQVIDETLQSFPVEVRQTISLVATELVSNAVKYGVSVPHAPNAHVTLIVVENQIQLAVRNGVASDDVVRELQAHLAELDGDAGKTPPYLRRLQQLLDDPRQTGRLGLYRIAFETGFTLTCGYKDQVLTLTATRVLG